jgi:acetylornithine deacetylase/succinyl-diaminopimelate desuccinylase-like protein
MKKPIVVLAAFASLALSGLAAAQSPDAQQLLARDIYKELVEIRTVHPDGDNTAAARAMAKRLLDAGFDPKDVQVIEPAPRKGNLVARLRGTGELKPLLLLAHIDVVEAKAEDWSGGLDPFKLTERDGFFYGRGTLDNKATAAIYIANLIRLKREGPHFKRDVIVALTADEEGGTHNGVMHLLDKHRALIDAEFAINEGATGDLIDGKPRLLGVQVAEKSYQSYELEATNPGGHSSLPRADNAIYDLAAALDRIARMQLPARLGYVPRMLALRSVPFEKGEVASALLAIAEQKETPEHVRIATTNPRFNAQFRTTCVATRLEGGHADNALPQRARATVNCRLLPDEKPELVQQELQNAAGPRVTVKPKNPVSQKAATDPRGPAMKAIDRVAGSLWPGAEILPVMSAGATDGSWLRGAGIPVYGVTGLFIPMGEDRMHGRDERLPVKSFYDGLEFHYRLLRTVGDGP